MRKRTTKKTTKPLIADKGADFIWATLSILSLPVVALSLTAMDWHPLVSFLIGVAATLCVIFIEAVIRGKLWIFQEQHRAVFGHQDTAFRILIVSGGVLLFIQTFLILQVIENPKLDHILLNLVIQKQCQINNGPLTPIICPLFQAQKPVDMQNFALNYSLEQASKTKLLPQYISGTCKTKILQNQTLPSNKFQVQFFALCAPLKADGGINTQGIKTSLITTELLKNNDDFYQPLVWQQDDTSADYQKLLNDDALIHSLNLQLIQQRRNIINNQ
ncbi:hypothetical protein KKG46_00655 [Patescibacteria group bacterium]|nr:hypothetical protein [Patescibacteria group bacterium]